MTESASAAPIPSLFDLRGKVAMVTGAAHGGLGHHSAVALAESGADVVLWDVEQRSGDVMKTAEAVEGLGRRAVVEFCDVSDEEQVEGGVAAAVKALGGIDILAHHAGVMIRKEALEITRAEWQRVININLTGTWLVNRCVARGMVQRGSGRIINTSTVYTNIVGPIPESPYYASKAGVANLTRGLAMEWGRYGIGVNCIAPGLFYPTNMTAPLKDQPDRLDWMAKRTMLGRVGDPAKDLKGAIVFLASAASSYITGQTIFVDGGWTSW